jgi:flavodoxin/Fe-S-cluster-containing hydrogenase component 2
LKILIIYFSQTGGTELIAKQIRNGVLKSGNECVIIKLKDINAINLDDFDIIGLGCPTFFYREPYNVRNFILNLPNLSKHAFIFATHGSCLGNTFYYLSEELKAKGLVVIGGFDSYSDSSLQFYPAPMHTHGHPDEIELQEAEEFGKNICNLSSRIKNGEKIVPKFELIEKTWWARDSKLMTREVLRKISPQFTINNEKCTKCMTCQTKCPGDAIDIEANPPEIQQEGCIFCWFCEKICPEGAIETDWTFMRENARANLKKYVKLLKEAEDQGKFRPHVHYEKIY